MIVYIVSDKSPKAELLLFCDRVRVFTDVNKALAAFELLHGPGGFNNWFSMKPEPKVGKANIYKCGDVDAELLTLEVTE